MPIFEDIEVEMSTKIDVEFEVYCGTCGAGLCIESDTRRSRGRNYLQVTVNACPSCIKEKEDYIKDLENQISELEQRIE